MSETTERAAEWWSDPDRDVPGSGAGGGFSPTVVLSWIFASEHLLLGELPLPMVLSCIPVARKS